MHSGSGTPSSLSGLATKIGHCVATPEGRRTRYHLNQARDREHTKLYASPSYSANGMGKWMGGSEKGEFARRTTHGCTFLIIMQEEHVSL